MEGDKAFSLRPYEAVDEGAWLNLMDQVMVHSDAWEAVYTHKPKFHPLFDFVLVSEEDILGIFAGHLINANTDHAFWSAEIFAVHPSHTEKGLGGEILKKSRQTLTQASKQLVMWTRCPKAKAWYQQKGFVEIEKKTLVSSYHSTGEIHSIDHQNEKSGRTLWAFAREFSTGHEADS